MKKLAAVTAALLVLAGAWTRCSAQEEAPVRSSAELDQMLSPIALYPDPLIGLILPAAGIPSQIVMADRYIADGGDPNQAEQQPWDPSVQGLAHYPTVLKWMDDNLDWTTQLGLAFLSQQSDVMDAIQRLRSQAQALGNLPSTPQETVVDDSGAIDIDPVNPDEIYVPDYQPAVIYSQPGVYCSFGIGFPIGAWLGFDWDWRHHHLISWGRGHERPGDWWHRPPADRHRIIIHDSNHNNVWHPSAHAPSVIVRGGDRGYENHTTPRRAVAPITPRQPAPRSNPVARAPEPARPVAPRTEAPRISRSAPAESPRARAVAPVQRSAPPESVFGGSQSPREVHESSSRGQISRGEVGGAPIRSAPSSGGGAVRSAPSGGGGGGVGSGGGRKR